MSEGTQRRLAAIVSADVVGYSRLMGVDEVGTLNALRTHRSELIDPLISDHGGRIVKTMGDGLLLEFPSVVDATQCVIEVQQGMAERNVEVDEDRRITFRIGVNLGDIIIEGEDILGDGVNIAARLQEIAEPGGVAISGRVHDDVRDRLDAGFADTGEKNLKNITRPVRVWQWLPVALASTAPAAADAPLPLPNKPSIAVLPFDNMSGDPEQEYFSDGISEDIITGLSALRWLFVIARNSSFTYKGRAVDVKDIARDLGVRYVLEGSVRKAGERVRVTAQLIEATTGNHVWAHRYDRHLDDIFDLQDEITQTIVGAIEPELAVAERERVVREKPNSFDAWDRYQRGLWHHYRFTKEDNAEAQALFRQAIELDPSLSRAYAGLAHTGYWDVLFGFTDEPEETLEWADEAGQKALTLDNKDPMAHWALGRVRMLRGDLDRAIAELDAAIHINPSYAHAYYGLSFAQALAGMTDKALENNNMAFRLSPHDPSLWTFYAGRTITFIVRREFADAVISAQKCVQQAHAGAWAHALLAIALVLAGETDAARNAVEELRRVQPEFSEEFVRQRLLFRDPAHLNLFLDALRKAGVSE